MNVLVVSRKEPILHDLTEVFKGKGDGVFLAQNTEICFQILEQKNITFCLLESLSEEECIKDFLAAVRRTSPKTKVILLNQELRKASSQISAQFSSFHKFEQEEIIIGDSHAMQNVYRKVQTAAVQSSRVLILGENGTGKELVAQKLHHESKRSHGPFVCLNCAAIPETLMESEFFGHVRGAFTGASLDRKGKIEQANGGTLFLDEVAEMPLSIQAKLLRFLQEMKICRLGSNSIKPVNVRIIAATNKDLKLEVAKGRFREDLYYRLNVITIQLPPLRERAEDIPLLINYFSRLLSAENHLPVKTFDEEALRFLAQSPWPGNVRQLRNFVERIMVMTESSHIYLKEAHQYMDLENPPFLSQDFWIQFDPYSLQQARELFESIFIKKKLKENRYNLTKTANILGMFPGNLKAKLLRLGIDSKEQIEY